MHCAACGSSLPDGARFCPGCGARTDAGPAVPTSSGSEPAERRERRLLTVLFADLAGFTAASDGADVEDVHARVHPWQRLVRRHVEREGGTVARVMGDGLMVVWGYLGAREDDALRAVRAALRILDDLPATGDALHARIGINTGEALVTFGSELEDADDAMGDAVNVAARLQGAAALDTVVIGAMTARLLDGVAVLEPLPPLILKGKAEPVAAWRALTASAGGSPARPSGHPFVGRSLELAELRASVDAARRALVRRLVIGGPGIGKSRLVDEARRETAAADPGIRWYTGRCIDGGTVPAAAAGEVLKAWAGILDDDDPLVARSRLERAIPGHTPDRAWLLDRLAPLVGAAGDARPSREESARAWVIALEHMSREAPVVVVLEDVHWADDDLVAMLTAPAPDTMEARVLVVATLRPEALERHPALAAIDPEPLRPAPLDDAEGAALLASLTWAAGLGADTKQSILARCGGNPLFAGELARLVAQQATATGDGLATPAGLPVTVAAVIGARLDLLPAVARALVHDAAVIGERCWASALAAVAEPEPTGQLLPATLAGDTEAALDDLVRLELLTRVPSSSIAGEAEYAFTHGLVREVAYGRLTRADRAARHVRAATWLGAVSGTGREDLAGTIADHDVRALELAASADAVLPMSVGLVRARATGNLLTAGRHAWRLDAGVAASRFARAAEIAVTERSRLQALVLLAAAGADAGDARSAAAAADEAIALADATGDPVAATDAQLARCRARRALGDPRWSADARAAAARLVPAGPSPALLRACAAMTLVEQVEGTREPLLDWCARTEAVARELGMSLPAEVLERRGWVRAFTGDRGGLGDLEQAIEGARRDGDSRVEADAMADLALARVYLGEPERALVTLDAVRRLTRERGLAGAHVQQSMNRAAVLRLMGRHADCLAALDEAQELAAGAGGALDPVIVEFERAALLATLGDTPGADAACSRLERHAGGMDGVPRHLVAIARAITGGAAGRPSRAAVDEVLETLVILEGDDLANNDVTAFVAVGRAAASAGAGMAIRRLRSSTATTYPLGATVALHLDALSAQVAGDHEAAAASLARALQAWEQLGWAPEAAATHEDLAASLAALDRPREARAHLEAARDAWLAMDAPLRAGRIVDRATSLG